jgi:ubiquinone/menaquinone biosynthesis C-methylase UbiE
MNYVRPDVFVFIVDFVRGNLIHAKNVLGSQINKNIFLVHGDATDLIFYDNTFDGWWSVQTLQHIPNFEKAVKEAYRVLAPSGMFANYSVNVQSFVRFVYCVMGKHYHIAGQIPGTFYLARASDEQLKMIQQAFN